MFSGGFCGPARLRGRCVAFFVACSLAAVVLTAPAPAAEAVVVRTALIYGDSLTLEARPTITARFAPKASWRAVVQAIPGVALCEYTTSLVADLQSYRPSVVTIETHGGTNSPATGCFDSNMIRDSPEYYSTIRADLAEIFAAVTATGAKVVFFATPPDQSAAAMLEQNTITSIAVSEAGNYHGVSISKAGRTALGGATWRGTLKCLAAEAATADCVDGRIIVRAPDTVHFCPVGYPNFFAFFAGCTTYSSGAFRYGRALVSATISPPKPVLP